MALKITISEREDVVVLELAGRIDSFVIDELNDGFGRAMKTGKDKILLIMRDLEYINSRGIGTLISFFKWVKKVGGLVKVAEVPLNIMQVLNILGLDGLTMIYDSASDAVESFHRGSSLVEESSDGIETAGEKSLRPGQEGVSGNPRTLMVALGAALLVVLVLLILLLMPDRRGPSPSELEPIQDRLEALEGRLMRLERAPAPVAVAPPEVRNDPPAKDLAGRLERLTLELERLNGKVSDMDRLLVGTSASLKAAPPTPGPRYHRVRPGESLYRISIRYGISVSELCRLNGLKPNRFIHPGQNLVVGTAEKGEE